MAQNMSPPDQVVTTPSCNSCVVILFPLTTLPPSHPEPPRPRPTPKSLKNVHFGPFRSNSVRFWSFWRVLGCWVGSGWGWGEGFCKGKRTSLLLCIWVVPCQAPANLASNICQPLVCPLEDCSQRPLSHLHPIQILISLMHDWTALEASHPKASHPHFPRFCCPHFPNFPRFLPFRVADFLSPYWG